MTAYYFVVLLRFYCAHILVFTDEKYHKITDVGTDNSSCIIINIIIVLLLDKVAYDY